MKSESFVAVILAAGKGSRMQTEGPKVMVPLRGKPLLLHVLENLHQAGCQRCILVLGAYRAKLRAFTQKKSPIKNIDFVFQEEQLGTGHALLCTEKSLSSHQGPFIVTAGDMPLLSSSSFRMLFRHHNKSKSVLTVLSATMQNPYGYGRVCRDRKGQIEKIVEEKDSSTQEREIQEVNTGTYALESPTIFPLLKEIGSKNSQGEYYLPDLVSIGRKKGHRLTSLCLKNSLEAKGINTLAELEALEKLMGHEQIRASSLRKELELSDSTSNRVKSSVKESTRDMRVKRNNISLIRKWEGLSSKMKALFQV